MVYIDRPKNGWSHLIADSIFELHQFASSIGIKKCWFENKKGKGQPHYDIRESNFLLAINKGAILVDRRFIVKRLKFLYSPPNT